jgi:hypothetical protein
MNKAMFVSYQFKLAVELREQDKRQAVLPVHAVRVEIRHDS